MKTSKLSPLVSEKKFFDDDIRCLGQGITKKLLEKYKPKYFNNIENMDNRKYQKGVA